MPSMLPASAHRSLPERVQVPQAKCQIPPKDVDGADDAVTDAEMLSLIETARRRAGLKLEYLASLSGVKVSTLSGTLNGHGSFNACWLWSWPPDFWSEYIPLLRAKKEQGPDAVRAARKERLIRAIELLLVEVA